MTDQHPVIVHWKTLCEKSGAAVYSGRNFLEARWPNGKKVSLRVDEEIAGVSIPHGSVLELKDSVCQLKPGVYVFCGADASNAIVQSAGEDAQGNLCGTGDVMVIERGLFPLCKSTGIVIELNST